MIGIGIRTWVVRTTTAFAYRYTTLSETISLSNQLFESQNLMHIWELSRWIVEVRIHKLETSMENLPVRQKCKDKPVRHKY